MRYGEVRLTRRKPKRKKKIRVGEVGNFLKNKLLDKIARHEDVTSCRESFAMNDVTRTVTQFKYLTAC